MRNVVLLVGSIALLALLFVGYSLVIDDPTPRPTPRGAAELLPEPAARSASDVMKIESNVGSVTVPPGTQTEFTVYDEKTGRATDRFRCSDWKSVAGSKNEIQVGHPELTMMLPSGMVAVITADEGQLTVERGSRAQMKPRFGWLRGNATITIDRATQPDRPPLSARPEDRIRIEMTRLDFDLERGELRSPDRVALLSDDLQIRGQGLELRWNQAANQVETLVIEKGEELVARGADWLGDFSGSRVSAATTRPSEPPGRATGSPNDAGHRARPPRSTTYLCTLTGGVQAQHLRGDAVLGTLCADEVRLIVDVGGTGGLLTSESSAPSSTQPSSTPSTIQSGAATPASAPATAPIDRLAVRWNGPLALLPVEAPPRATAGPRRRFEAVGQVRLEQADGQVRCEHLEYQDDTGQIWLRGASAGQVEFALGAGRRAAADSVYIDRRAGIIKMLGRVELHTTDGAQADALAIRCELWAELRVGGGGAGRTTTMPAGQLDFGRLTSAVFVGTVRTRLDREDVVADQLELTFAEGGGGEPLEALLERVVATGAVTLRGSGRAIDAGRLEVALEPASERAVARWLDARGDVQIREGAAVVRGEQVRARLGAPGAGADRRELYIESVEITGRAALRDAENRVAADGQRISAEFADGRRIGRASVFGTPQRLARVYAAPYNVRGEVIELDRAAESLRVDGRSRLSLRTQRGFQGEPRDRAVRVAVSANQRMFVDGAGNAIHFEGGVAARSGAERLRAESLTLLLEDAPRPPSRPSLLGRWQTQWRALRPFLQGGAAPDAGSLADSTGRRTSAKELARVIARRAVFESEVPDQFGGVPLTHSSIEGPEIEVDVRARVVRSTGQTTLLVTNRQLADEQPEDADVAGVPSALMTRGPSQTAMVCERSMTYALGAPGPGRRDAVLFEGRVRFRHLAGREMVNLEEMLPAIRDNPALLAGLRSRNAYLESERLECEFLVDAAADSSAMRTPLRLNLLNASANVYLRDLQGDGLYEMTAQQLEFDRPAGVVRVSGGGGADARITYENRKTGEFSKPAEGPDFTLDLRTNTLRAGRTSGAVQQP